MLTPRGARVQVIAKAKVPIIKWDDRHSGIALNICIGQKDGIRNTEWCQRRPPPPPPPQRPPTGPEGGGGGGPRPPREV